MSRRVKQKTRRSRKTAVGRRGEGQVVAGRRQRKKRKKTASASRARGPVCSATIRVEESGGGRGDRASHTKRVRLFDPAAKKGGQASSGRSSGRELPTLARGMAAVGHVARLRILQHLLDGPATYQALKRVTRLKVGPLYHHINQLRLAGLILPKQRDLYEATRGGRNLAMVAMVLPKLIRDRRRRPVGKGQMRTGSRVGLGR